MTRNRIKGLLKMLGAAVLLAGSFLNPAPANAAVIELSTSVEYTGGTPPTGANPWLKAILDDHGTTGSVTLTMLANNLSTNNGTNEDVDGWYFNINPALNPTSLIFTKSAKTGTFSDPTIATGANQEKAGANAPFDILFQFASGNPANRFVHGDSISYTITGISTLTAASFDFGTSTQGGQGPFTTAAHVRGTGTDGNGSGWVAAPVPEPGTGLLMTGAAGVALLNRPRGRKA